MNKFGKRSLDNLKSVDPALVRLCNAVLTDIDFTVICGHRNEADQNAAFRDGFSKAPWPFSKHNKIPSQAVDFIPSPFDGDWQKTTNLKRFYDIRLAFQRHAKRLGIKIRVLAWELPHVELVK